ncbi:MAG: SDR family NAD(P)-dependent oxidoreductase [Sandaracinaceae bacterium]|nr:SDR family NAD(P)-dependent oxidoreductase [Sandaracinaceae bacterium]
MKKLPRDARAVVTGGGSGLGRAICEDLAGRGARVLVTDVNLATAEETADTLRRRGSEAHAMQVDVRKPDQVEAMAKKATDLWGGTDVLVNNAGLAVVGELGKIPIEEWQFQVDVNLMGVIWGCHYFGPQMAGARQRLHPQRGQLGGPARGAHDGPLQRHEGGRRVALGDAVRRARTLGGGRVGAVPHVPAHQHPQGRALLRRRHRRDDQQADHRGQVERRRGRQGGHRRALGRHAVHHPADRWEGALARQARAGPELLCRVAHGVEARRPRDRVQVADAAERGRRSSTSLPSHTALSPRTPPTEAAPRSASVANSMPVEASTTSTRTRAPGASPGSAAS